MKNGLWVYCLILLLSLSAFESKGQTKFSQPSNYNEQFSGIGPKVYILPPPKTKIEIIQGQYSAKKKEQSELLSLIERQQLFERLKKVDNGELPFKITKDTSVVSREEQVTAAINYYNQINNLDSVWAWQNRLGIIKLLKGDHDSARELFLEVTIEYELLGDNRKNVAILNNLAILENDAGNLTNSLRYYDKLIAIAKANKDILAEGLYTLAIANIEAKLGNYQAAHNVVLTRSFPLLQKSKSYPDIVDALNTLALIKENEEKFVEAKWIYLQAADVATMHKDEKGLAESLFKIAELKNKIGDGALAIDDYKHAKELAIKHQMEALLIEIEDGIGDAYLNTGKYTEAALALNSYNILKVEFINKQILM